MAKATKQQKKRPRLPGTSEGSRTAPLAIIARKPRVTVTSGTGDLYDWYLTFAQVGRRWADPLMGWTGSDDTLAQIKLKFPDLGSAKRFAESQGWNYSVQDQPYPKIRPAPPLSFLAEKHLEPVRYSKSSRRAPATASKTIGSDDVDVAGLHSFPASDPPAWTGTSL